jgi:hypothetical protein
LDNSVDCSKVRGFNYQPSYARNGLDSWLDRFDAKTVAIEIGRGKNHFPHINTLRIWLSYEAYLQDPAKVLANIDTVLSIGADQGLKFIPVIFNGWHSEPDFGGVSIEQVLANDVMGMYDTYVDELVGPLANDPRILLWDLCNEPFNSCPCDDTSRIMLGWLTKVRQRLLSLGVTIPIGVGVCPSIPQMRLLEPISDIITFHPYWAWNYWVPTKQDYIDFLDESVAFAKEVGKPLLATETCWGALDDQQRADIVRFELSELKKRNIGWTCHLMHHSGVADAHRRWQPPNIGAGYMAFIEADGSLRPGHEVYNEF